MRNQVTPTFTAGNHKGAHRLRKKIESKKKPNTTVAPVSQQY